MSRTVDERVVEMRFDNKQFESNVQTSMGTLDKLKKSLNLEGASKGLENVNAAAKGFDASPLTNGIEAVRTKFSALQVMGITALSNITNSALNAGKRIASALTIDPIKSGFQEYETQINAVQTILANTSSKGTNLDQVNSALDELNHYADKTIYNFTEMTRNIGTFTAAGIDLDTSVNAIQGIANLAAVSGSTSQQASTAMYQLSQALASGTVKLMDWNSVVNAGMGGQVFQDALKETSKQLGTGAEAAIKANGSFRESLQTGWLTSEVLTETLKKFTTSGANEYVAEYTGLSADAVQAALDSAKAQYGEADAIDKASEALAQKSGKSKDEIKSALEMARTAEDAATKVKTFSQLIDTLKEAVQSGWTQSWETIIGDFEEAKSLFTELSDTFGGVIQESADARNAMLEGWAGLGGRQDLIDSFWNIYNALAHVIAPIREAFQEIFPPTTAEQLKAFTEGLKEFTSKLILNDTQMEHLHNTFRGFFAVVDIGVTFLKELAGGIIEIVGSLLGFGSGILGATGSIGEFLANLRDSIKEADIFGTIIDKVVGFITGAIGKIKDFGSALKDSFVSPDFSGFTGFLSSLAKFAGSVGSKVVEAFSSIGSAIAGMFGEDDIFDALNNMLTTGILVYVVKFVQGLKDTFETAGGVLENVTGILDDVRGCFQAYQDQLKAGTLMKIATAIGILAASLFVLSTIDPEDLGSAVSAITALFAELLASLALFEKMSVSLKGVSKAIPLMIGMSAAVLILSGAMKILSTLDWNGLAKGLVGVTGLVGILIGAAKLMDGNSKHITKFAGQMVIMSVAIGALAVVAKVLGSMSWSELGKAGAGILGLVSILVAAAKIMDSENASVTKFAGQMLVMSLAIGALSLVAKMLGSMSWSELGKAGAGILGLTVMLVAAAKIMNSDSASITKFGGQMLLMAASLAIITPVLKTLGSMSWEAIAKGLVAIAGALGILVVALHLMQGTLAGSAALLVAAAALAIIAPVLKNLGEMTWEEIAKGLIALAGALAVVGIAGALLTPVIPAILGLGVAFALLGVGMIGLGAGLTLIGIGLTAIATAGAAAATSLVASITIIVTGLLDLIPQIAGKIGEAIIAIAQVIGECAPALADALLKLVASVLESLAEYVPQMVDSLITLWVGILSALTEHMPELINSLFDFLIAVLNGLSARMPEFIEAGVGLIASILNGIAQALGPLVELVVGPLVESIGAALAKIADSMAPIVESISQAIQAICEAFISLVEQISPIIDSIVGLVEQLGESIALVFQSISDVISTCGETIATILSGVAEIIETTFSGISEVITSIGDSIRTVLDGIAGIIEEMGEAALNAGTGFENLANGVKTITELDLADMAISMAAVATGVGKIASHADGLAMAGEGMRQIEDSVTNSSSYFISMASSLSTALSLLNLIGPAASSAADAVSSAVSNMGVSFSGVFQSMLTSALSAVTGSVGAFSAAGRNLSQGLQNGIKSGIAPITKLVSSTMKAAALSVKAASPAFLANGLLLMTMLANGLRAGAGVLQSTLASIVSTAAATLYSYQSMFMTAGMFMAQGFANGISANAALATMAARSMALSAIAAAKAATGEQSPSKVFHQIGAYTAIGLANGIKDNSKIAEKASGDMGTAILESIQKRLNIHSPSVVFNKEVGRYVVQGIAEGITNDMSAEKAAKQKASNIVSAFRTELEKYSLDNTTTDLEYELWSNTVGLTASETSKNAEEVNKLADKLDAQTARVKLANDEYQLTMMEFGETAEETQQAYNKLLTEKIETSKLSAELAEIQGKEFAANVSSLDSFTAWMRESGEELSKMGIGTDALNAVAKERTGYTGGITFDFSKEWMEKGEKDVEDKAGKASGKVGEAVVNGLANALKDESTKVITASKSLVFGGLKAAKETLGVHSPSKEFYQLGVYSVQGFVNAFRDLNTSTYDAGYGIGTNAMDGLGNAISHVKSVIAGGIDSEPTIKPVIDMSLVSTKGLTVDSNVKFSFSKPVDALSQLVSAAQADIMESNREVINAVKGLRDDLNGFYTSMDEKETALYVDSKKLATSIAKPMNRELNILSKRGPY